MCRRGQSESLARLRGPNAVSPSRARSAYEERRPLRASVFRRTPDVNEADTANGARWIETSHALLSNCLYLVFCVLDQRPSARVVGRFGDRLIGWSSTVPEPAQSAQRPDPLHRLQTRPSILPSMQPVQRPSPIFFRGGTGEQAEQSRLIVVHQNIGPRRPLRSEYYR
jgi:hypothetical protein